MKITYVPDYSDVPIDVPICHASSSGSFQSISAPVIAIAGYFNTNMNTRIHAMDMAQMRMLSFPEEQHKIILIENRKPMSRRDEIVRRDILRAQIHN